MQVYVSGMIEVSAFLEIDEVAELAKSLGLESDISLQEIAKELVMEGLKRGMNTIAQRVEESSVEDHYIFAEEVA